MFLLIENSFQNLFISFGPTEATFIKNIKNFPEGIIGRSCRFVRARAEKSWSTKG